MMRLVKEDRAHMWATCWMRRNQRDSLFKRGPYQPAKWFE